MFSLLASAIPAGLVSIVALYTYARRSGINQSRHDEESEFYSDAFEEHRRDSRDSSTSSYHSFASPPPSPTRRISDRARLPLQPSRRDSSLPSLLFPAKNVPTRLTSPNQEIPSNPSSSNKRLSPHSTFSIGTLQSYQKEFGVFYCSSQQAFIPVPTSLIDVPLYEPIPPIAPRPPRSSINTYHGRKGWGGYTKVQPKEKEPEKDEEEEIGSYPPWKIQTLDEDEDALYGLPALPIDAFGNISRPEFLKNPPSFSRRSSSSWSSSSSSDTLPPTPTGSERLSYNFPPTSLPKATHSASSPEDPFVALD